MHTQKSPMHPQKSLCIVATLFNVNPELLFPLERALCTLERGICTLKRALFTLKRAVFALQKALCTPKTALRTLKRALFTLKIALITLQSAMFTLKERSMSSLVLSLFCSHSLSLSLSHLLLCCSTTHHGLEALARRIIHVVHHCAHRIL